MEGPAAPAAAPVIALDEIVVTARRGDQPATPAAGPTPPADALTITADGRTFGGWDSVKVTRGCERMPSSFSISMTERFPEELARIVMRPGASCVVKMGTDTVMTGYVQRYEPAIDAKSHTVTATGASKSQDLAECSVIFDAWEIGGQTVGAIVRTLAGKYGITVSTPAGEGPVVPQLNMQFGETTWSVVERLCRFAKFLAYDDVEGNIVLRPVSTERHASGARQGDNVKAARGAFGMDQRFSEYHVHTNAAGTLSQAEQAAGGSGIGRPAGEAKDEGVPRLRRRVIILEHSGVGDLNGMAKARAEWEASRRRGRSEAITVTVDNWRDSAGKLWEPNRLVPVHVPSCQVRDQNWILGEVTFLRGENGTTADLTLMPPVAFDPEYVPLYTFSAQIRASLASGPGE